ncbi:MAG TPA: hypothetical protein VJV79_17135 [Polyangiaceae bacterium]|nr:hypothetical protein [Polyangiaceae bacterium]
MPPVLLRCSEGQVLLGMVAVTSERAMVSISELVQRRHEFRRLRLELAPLGGLFSLLALVLRLERF